MSLERTMARRQAQAVGGWKRDHEWEAALKAVWDREMPGAPQPQGYRRGLLAALVGREPIGGRSGAEPRWHVSVQHQDRVPSVGRRWSRRLTICVRGSCS